MLGKTVKPNCYIVAGPNGAGKTTFATRFLPCYADCRNFINPDLFTRALSPFDPDAGLLQAGRIVLERIDEFTKAKTDFAFETTLSGRAYVSVIHRLRTEGFQVHMFYIWIHNLDLTLSRIRNRVESGGHNVPELDVRRRFTRTLHNLFTLYRPLLHTLHFYENSLDIPRLIFKEMAGKTTVLEASLYQEVLRAAAL